MELAKKKKPVGKNPERLTGKLKTKSGLKGRVETNTFSHLITKARFQIRHFARDVKIRNSLVCNFFQVSSELTMMNYYLFTFQMKKRYGKEIICNKKIEWEGVERRI